MKMMKETIDQKLLIHQTDTTAAHKRRRNNKSVYQVISYVKLRRIT